MNRVGRAAGLALALVSLAGAPRLSRLLGTSIVYLATAWALSLGLWALLGRHGLSPLVVVLVAQGGLLTAYRYWQAAEFDARIAFRRPLLYLGVLAAVWLASSVWMANAR